MSNTIELTAKAEAKRTEVLNGETETHIARKIWKYLTKHGFKRIATNNGLLLTKGETEIRFLSNEEYDEMQIIAHQVLTYEQAEDADVTWSDWFLNTKF